MGIAHVREGRHVFEDLTVDENLVAASFALDGRPGAGKADTGLIYEYFPRLKERRAQRAGYLSGGEQQMLAIARSLRTGARLLLLDEPTEGLAPVIVQHIGQIIRTLKKKGFTVLLVEQNFHFASTVADRHYVVEHGKVIDMIDNDQVGANIAKLESYLGV
jgi:branched-chain amino acid transport system ATP-binding protein